ncbi:MAG TPA: hypothetical protein VL026_00615 [Rhizomicrobium sp.]|nr:hypothetical protein [Rhizomicrobium sp.]
MIIAVVGLVREAQIIAGAAITPVVGGGDGAGLEHLLATALAKPNISGVISIGIAGGLSPDVRPGSIVAATAIVAAGKRFETDLAWRQRLLRAIPNCRLGVIAGSDRVIAHRPEKTDLYERTGAIAVDMESHIAAAAAAARQVPFAALRVVCDPGDRTVPPAALVAMRSDGSIDAKAVLRSVMAAPQQLLSLGYLARDSAQAFRTLLRCRNFLGDGLCGPDIS